MTAPVDSDLRVLLAGASALGVAISERQGCQLLAYRELLRRWNRVSNLTAIDDPQAMLTRHLLDSLSVAPYLRGGRIADVGSGAGLPGLVLALVQPKRRFALIDARRRKVQFLIHCAAMLKLDNIEPLHARAETLTPAPGYDTVICRAFASLAAFLAAGRHLCSSGGRMLAMKGAYPGAELAAVANLPTRVIPLEVPGLNAARHVVIMTPDYPLN